MKSFRVSALAAGFVLAFTFFASLVNAAPVSGASKLTKQSTGTEFAACGAAMPNAVVVAGGRRLTKLHCRS
ncbi:MAG: hypothetical protein ABI439_00765 [Rhodospirillales bacterium]